MANLFRSFETKLSGFNSVLYFVPAADTVAN